VANLFIIYLFIMQITRHDKRATQRAVQTSKANLTQRQTKMNNV